MNLIFVEKVEATKNFQCALSSFLSGKIERANLAAHGERRRLEPN
jgi:hypothetical protein